MGCKGCVGLEPKVSRRGGITTGNAKPVVGCKMEVIFARKEDTHTRKRQSASEKSPKKDVLRETAFLKPLRYFRFKWSQKQIIAYFNSVCGVCVSFFYVVWLSWFLTYSPDNQRPHDDWLLVHVVDEPSS